MVYVVSYQPGSPIQVYAADGRHVLTTSDNQFRLEPGFYLITCGPVSKKLRVD
jgi:FtsP/CotA-like multicopper oxidase with cupredoxin domain